MSESKKEDNKIISLRIVVEAGKVNSETGEVVELVPGLEKPTIEQLLREISAGNAKIDQLEKHLEELRKAKGLPEEEEKTEEK